MAQSDVGRGALRAYGSRWALRPVAFGNPTQQGGARSARPWASNAWRR